MEASELVKNALERNWGMVDAALEGLTETELSWSAHRAV